MVGMIKVFISHPLTGNFAVNRASADRICRRLAKQGLLPISPLHLFSFYDSEDHATREAILQVCFRLIDLCDEVWVYGDSEGCRLEADYAKRIGKIVRRVGTEGEGWERLINICGEADSE
jgi:dienelactone hydrolase